MREITVSALEYEALLNLDKMLRIAMQAPGTGDFLVGAIQALDQVRRDEGITIPESPPTPAPQIAGVSSLAADLIARSMQKDA